MNRSYGQGERLLQIIEMAYAASDDGEMVRSVFTALRELMSFASGVFMPVNPETLELQPGLCFDCSAADMETYLAHYAPLDPFVQQQPGPALLNRTMRFSDVITTGDVGRSEFSTFLRQVPYHHALGILTGLAQQPVAVFSVHRQRHERDFSADEQALLDCVGPHLARAIHLRRQVSDPTRRAETGILVFGSAGQALYLNAPAQRFLGTTPPAALCAALPTQGAAVIKLAWQYFRLSRVPWATTSLLCRFAVAEAANGVDQPQADAGPVERWSAAMRQRSAWGGATVVVLQPFQQRTDFVRRLEVFGLSPRQLEVATWALRGLANDKIADTICLAEKTVKDYLQEIYHRIGVGTRPALLAKVLGTSAIPAELGKRRR